MSQQFSEKKQGQMAAGETSREKKHPVKYPAGDVRRCQSLFLPWWRGHPGAWWHSRRPAGFKECGKRQRRVKEPQSGREGGTEVGLWRGSAWKHGEETPPHPDSVTENNDNRLPLANPAALSWKSQVTQDAAVAVARQH